MTLDELQQRAVNHSKCGSSFELTQANENSLFILTDTGIRIGSFNTPELAINWLEKDLIKGGFLPRPRSMFVRISKWRTKQFITLMESIGMHAFKLDTQSKLKSSKNYVYRINPRCTSECEQILKIQSNFII